MPSQHSREIIHVMPDKAVFQKHVFKEALKRIPDTVIFEMAKDGEICEQEIERLAELMELGPEQTALMLHYKRLIAKAVLRYAQVEHHLQVNRNQARLHATQAVQIMHDLLESGLIERYMEKVYQVKSPGVTPGLKDALDKSRGL